ncbi:MAG: tetratricopeptide repeat protein [Candidatus Zhuqueibacterota bacterium]
MKSSVILRQGTCAIRFLIFAFFMAAIIANPVIAQTSQATHEANSEKERIRALVQETKKVDQATQLARNAVRAFSDSLFLPELLFQLSEWEVRKEKLHFELAMIKYDRELELFDDKKLAVEPTEPVLDYKNTLEINRRIVKEFPQVPYIGKVMYRTGICLYEMGHRDSSRQIFENLIANYPDSTYLAEIIFRLGECYFDEQRYDVAINTYQQILQSWDSPYFAMSLYKIAWCHYQMENYSDAISTFYYLLNDIHLLESVDTDLLGKTQVQLKDEAIEYIAISFSDFGGVSALLAFINEMNGSAYTPDFLHKLGDIYLRRDFYEDAESAFNHVTKNYPLYFKMPYVYYSLFTCHEKSRDIDKSFKTRSALVDACGPKSQWALTSNQKENSDAFNALLTDIDFKLATPMLCTADSLFAAEKYTAAEKKYDQFIKTFPGDERLDHAYFFLSECLYNTNDYVNAAENYQHLVEAFPKSELREDAGYNYLVCHDRLCQSAFDSASTAGSEELKNSAASKDLIQASSAFLKWFPESEKGPEVKLKLAEIFSKIENYATAEKFAMSALSSILKQKKGLHHKSNALNMLALFAFKQEKYEEAERWSTILIKQHPDSLELVEKSKIMLASSTFKIGEKLKSQGDVQKAAFKFERASVEATDPNIAEASLFEAALQFEKANQIHRAAMNFESFFKKYPNSEHCQEAIYRAAVLREKEGQYFLAAKNFLTLHEKLTDPKEAAGALYNAGLAYEKTSDWTATADIFNRYLKKFPNDADRALEAMFKVAYAYEKKNLNQKAQIGYQNVLSRYDQLMAAGDFADDVIAAQAAFRQGEIKRTVFEAIALKPPFQQNLKRKQQAFNDVLKCYVDVTKFNIAEWTTAAFYQLGLSYEKFCHDILKSPAPPNLNKEELNTYWTTIQQQWIIPLETEAMKYYQTNEKLALENSVKNDWVDKTRSRITFLTKKLAQGHAMSPNNQVKETVGANSQGNRTVVKHNL